MNDLIIIEKEKAFTTSRIIAEHGDIEHRAMIQLIKNYTNDLNDIGLSAFEMRKFKTSGRTGEEAILDEIQATFLITLMKNSKKVVTFKKNLTREFFKQRQIINRLIFQRENPDWQDARKDGKIIYHQKIDVIKIFVDYAINQGSINANRYYSNIAKMENKALFFFEQKYKNMREVLTIRQLMQVATADDVIEKALKDGMREKMDYKDIYKLAKTRIISYAEIIGRSPILQLGE